MDTHSLDPGSLIASLCRTREKSVSTPPLPHHRFREEFRRVFLSQRSVSCVVQVLQNHVPLVTSAWRLKAGTSHAPYLYPKVPKDEFLSVQNIDYSICLQISLNTMQSANKESRASTSCTECQRRKQKVRPKVVGNERERPFLLAIATNHVTQCSREWPCNHCQARKVPHLCQFGTKRSQQPSPPESASRYAELPSQKSLGLRHSNMAVE